MALNISPGDDAVAQEQAEQDSVVESAENAPALAEQTVDENAADVAQEAPVAEESAPVSADNAHDLIDELEDLVGRAHHFENAGIEKLRAGGLALIERIRAAL